MLPLLSKVLAKGQKREALSNLNDNHGRGAKKSTLIEFRPTYLSEMLLFYFVISYRLMELQILLLSLTGKHTVSTFLFIHAFN